MFLAGSTKPDWSVAEGSDSTLNPGPPDWGLGTGSTALPC